MWFKLFSKGSASRNDELSPVQQRQQQEAQDCASRGDLSWLIKSLPEPLLEKIVTQHTSIRDKKALRETCRYFCDMLDEAMTTLVVKHDTIRWNFELKAWLQCLPKLQTMCFYNIRQNMMQHLPATLTTVYLKFGPWNNIQPLAALPLLTTICMDTTAKLEGLGSLTGLTRLEVNWQVGSPMHIAPTLRHLDVKKIDCVQHVEHLTNLKVLVTNVLAPSALSLLQSLPLQHLAFEADDHIFRDEDAWRAMPSTLASLAIGGKTAQLFPDVLPISITRLHLFEPSNELLQQAAIALPHLKHLDVSFNSTVIQQAVVPTPAPATINTGAIIPASHSFRLYAGSASGIASYRGFATGVLSAIGSSSLQHSNITRAATAARERDAAQNSNDNPSTSDASSNTEGNPAPTFTTEQIPTYDSLCDFKHLKSLRIFVQTDRQVWDRDRVMSLLPAVAMLVGRNVDVEVLDDAHILPGCTITWLTTSTWLKPQPSMHST